MIYNHELTRQIAAYVSKLFSKFQTPQLVYHNLIHTQNVFGKMNEISLNYSLNETDLFILSAATWFHDCGHLYGPAADHEIKSALIMRSYIEGIGVEERIIRQIQHCILSTKLPNDPQSLLAEILCDADLYHLGTDEFIITDELVKKEFELRNNFLPSNWDESTLTFLERHTYFTAYCAALLQKGKLNNIASLREKINRKR
jgi:predicted metal-dependent HD superfamily phosphohydrolase